MKVMKRWGLCLSILVACALGPAASGRAETGPVWTAPLRVLLIPADGGTEDGTKADFKPLFDALSRVTGLEFEVRVGQSYSAVIDGMCAGQADIAWFGPVSYLEARDRGCAELLGIEERGGSTSYYAGLFVLASSGIKAVDQLSGRTLALGSSHSASSFAYPLAVLRDAGIDPLTDLRALRLSESHTQSLMALSSGQVDAAGASLTSFERAMNQGGLDASRFRILARSDPIPNPPLAVSSKLPDALQDKLRAALAKLHETPGVKTDAIRGYGGKRVDRYVTDFDEADLDKAAERIAFIDDDLKAALIRKAGAVQD
ncbi:MAG: phosphate/phosphite/phosphonate ABC transporter substrate-binding protein [Hyphomonas sp.]|nr:phosphate/phosphite/phosphonate ABC transporter substrate-binding protein [Hyphomonas sp.]MBU4062152.1 phosphate/phosphite/phosphonate ABC transporter substrate-binding protein [Alphaproteobacteria bacterium]MBU4165587.1 phosphate/phosphite/phosphonate ABC transporter substrate-binding protein [Alphaproteobacteria bacterium]